MTAVLTYLHTPTRQTDFMAQTAQQWYPIINACTDGRFRGNGFSMQRQYEAMKYTKYDKLIYTDAGDTVFMRPLDVPNDYILYATEQACWPRSELAALYPDTASYYKYLNGGGCCGPTALLIEFYERYGLHKLAGESSVQGFQAKAFLAAIAEGFPIKLDYWCTEFQTTAFAAAGDFNIESGIIKNNATGTYPGLFHGNGGTNMEWIYELLESPA